MAGVISKDVYAKKIYCALTIVRTTKEVNK